MKWFWETLKLILYGPPPLLPEERIRLVRIRTAPVRCFVCCQPLLDGDEAVAFDGAHSHIACAVHQPFVAYWDEHAWVAGTSRYNCVTQGPTLEETVDRLARTLRSEMVLSRKMGNTRPFQIDFPGKEPLKAFLPDGTETEYVPEVEPDRLLRYRGWVRIPSIKEMLS